MNVLDPLVCIHQSCVCLRQSCQLIDKSDNVGACVSLSAALLVLRVLVRLVGIHHQGEHSLRTESRPH